MSAATIPLVWLLLSAVCLSVGCVGARCLLPAHLTKQVSPFALGWAGLATLLVAFQFVSLFTPINGTCLLTASVVGSGALTWSVVRWLRHARSTRHGGRAVARAVLWLALVAGLSFMALAGTMGRPLRAYDTLLYHWNWVTWANTFPAVPGLANLHIRLGTNSAYLLLAAFLDNGPMDQRAAWILPPLVPLLVTLQCLHRMLQPLPLRRLSRLVALLFFPYAFGSVLSAGPGLYFDQPALLLLGAWVVECLGWLESRPVCSGEDSGEENLPLLGFFAAPAFLSFLIKPIAAPVVFGLVLLGVGGLAARHRLRVSAKSWMATWLLPALMIAGWMARNAVLSGWLLFPAPMGRLPVDWAVPEMPSGPGYADQMQSVRGNLEIIRSWARHPGSDHVETANAPFRIWAAQWFDANRKAVELRLLLPGTVVLAAAGFFLAWPRRGGRGRRLLALHLVWLLPMLYWFHAAPDLRFADGLFALSFSIAAAIFLYLLGERLGEGVATSVAGTLAVALLAAYGVGRSSLPSGDVGPVGRSYALPTREVNLDTQTKPPLRVWVPVRGDQAGDAPLPTTPHPSASLRWRQAGHLGAGFRHGGAP